MKKRIYQTAILAIIIGFSIWSCTKEEARNNNINITSDSWMVVKIKQEGANQYKETKKSYVLKFENDTTYTLRLDVNNCTGKYTILNKGNIHISSINCTEMCCDSDFAEELVQLLSEMTEYYGMGENLILEGQGEIVLKTTLEK